MSTTKKTDIGPVLREGKTKKVCGFGAGDDSRVFLASKDNITAGDGAKHDVLPGKGEVATQTTCNVFRLLEACGVPTHFLERVEENAFLAQNCHMLPLEVVVRRAAHGSALSRHPGREKGHLFDPLVVEFFLKTSRRRWNELELPVDDPLIRLPRDDGPMVIVHPGEPIASSRTIHIIKTPAGLQRKDFARMARLARHVFLVLEKAWQPLGRRLVDLKVEFGRSVKNNTLLLADVVDNDSWRVVDSRTGEYIDKQVYRDGGDLELVAKNYRLVADLTSQFSLPRQQLVLWRGSEKDELAPFEAALGKVLQPHPHPHNLLSRRIVTLSMHKRPIEGWEVLCNAVHEVPDSVLIVYVGRSNGAGPILAAHTSVPVITVPAGYREFPDDVWSSLRVPSDLPVMTVLEPDNAVLAALQILAARNPALYALTRLDRLERPTEGDSGLN